MVSKQFTDQVDLTSKELKERLSQTRRGVSSSYKRLRKDRSDEDLQKKAAFMKNFWESFRKKASFKLTPELTKVLRKIPKKDRIILKGYYVDGLTQIQLAAAIGISQGAISHRLEKILFRVAFYEKYKDIDNSKVEKLLKRIMKSALKAKRVSILMLEYRMHQTNAAKRLGVLQSCLAHDLINLDRALISFVPSSEDTLQELFFIRDSLKNRYTLSSVDFSFWDDSVLKEDLIPEEYSSCSSRNHLISYKNSNPKLNLREVNNTKNNLVTQEMHAQRKKEAWDLCDDPERYVKLSKKWGFSSPLASYSYCKNNVPGYPLKTSTKYDYTQWELYQKLKNMPGHIKFLSSAWCMTEKETITRIRALKRVKGPI